MSQRPKLSFCERRAIVPHREFVALGRNEDAIPTDSKTPNLDNVQGDVYFMFPKKWEQFLFFKITDTAQFRKDLDKYAPHITSSRRTAQDLLDIHTYGGAHKDIVSSGIAFARAGLNLLDINRKLGDPHFDKGSLFLEKKELGDMAQYDPVFDGDGKSHGVILLTAREQKTCQEKMNEIKTIFSNSIEVVTVYEGRVRVGDGEHFGWRDGISQPAMDCKWGVPKPGQHVVKPGVIIMGYPGDPVYDDPRRPARPSFTKDGTFMVFRKLEQNVLFFEDYVNKNWPSIPAQPETGVQLNTEQRKLLFGARLVGRFKSGVPLARSPYIEDPINLRPERINNFDYTETNGGCPFAAHIRKTEPRNLEPIVDKNYLDASVIIRAGLPYGAEISAQEREQWKKMTEDQKENAVCDRGLLFVCYQSSIDNGFFRQTTGFANNDFFPITGLAPKKIGQDPIIGGPQPRQQSSGQTDISQEGHVTLEVINRGGVKFEVTGVAQKLDTSATTVVEKFFVTSHGGEYYFVPSISTVKAWAGAN
ncbi:hypothetical protein EDD15DRAFT_2284759 [Pisolithus albus]|nr:hypothetical protein EDD15DRAFT_2284759 [Pisolithus albus]